jgi:hypothetical protein
MGVEMLTITVNLFGGIYGFKIGKNGEKRERFF